MLLKLREEKALLAKAKRDKQLNLSDAPRKIKVEKKRPSIG